MELRRQKEMTKSHHDRHGKDTAMILDVSSDGDDYFIHHNVVWLIPLIFVSNN